MSDSALIKAALLGTQRHSQMPDAPHDSLAPTWQAIVEQDDPAVALLQAAAIEQVSSQVGQPVVQVNLPEPCPAEEKPLVPSAAARSAADLMDGSFLQLLREWIVVARDHGYVATPRLLPALLEFGETNPSMRDAIGQIVGVRGRWLSDQTGQWLWLTGSTAEALVDQNWETGSASQRRAWLAVKLQSDPAQAAQAVDSAWGGDSPEARESFTELAARYPNPVHESWLQDKALKDRRQSLRQLAVRALMQIPESGFRQRSLTRARNIVSMQRKMLGKNLIEFAPPDKFDPDWKADGIREKPPGNTGQKAYWALQILGAIPLRDWASLIDHPEPFALKIDTDWSELVLNAWQQAAVNHPDADAVQPLLKRFSGLKDDEARLKAIVPLVGLLEHDRIADLLEPLRLPDVHQLALLRQFLPALSYKRHPQLHKTIGTALISDVASVSRADAIALAGCCDRTQISALLAKVSALKEMSSATEEFARALEYRHGYLKHFSDNNESTS